MLITFKCGTLDSLRSLGSLWEEDVLKDIFSEEVRLSVVFVICLVS